MGMGMERFRDAIVYISRSLSKFLSLVEQTHGADLCGVA